MKKLKKKTWKVHTLATCQTCGWHSEEYTNGQGLAAIHAKTKGHTVTGEVGLAFKYEGLLTN